MSQIHQTSSNQQPSNKPEELAIQSSFIQAVSYDATSLRLTVNFKSGSSVTHLYVFPAVYQQFLEAPSKGSFYSRQIKGKYQGISTDKPLMPSDVNKAKPFKFKK